MSAALAPDFVDAALPGEALHALRRQRARVVDASQAAHDAVFAPALPGLTLTERLEAALVVARATECEALAACYRQALAACPAPLEGARRDALLGYARTLAERPRDAGRERLLALPAAGLDVDAVVTLAQLIGLVAYQARVVAGLAAMTDVQAPGAPAEAAPAAPFVHPANLPAPGQPVRINGYTSEPLDWKAWLPVLELAQATDYQRAVLKASHPTASSSDYYLTLARQPRILEQRSAAFNAIMYAPGGLSRAERELASTVTSRVNGCVYCAAVHALRYEQLTGHNAVIAQVFDDPESAGTTARERAIVQAAIVLTREPSRFGQAQLGALAAAGVSSAETLDLVHAIAIFAWANRLMLNLGEPVFPAREEALILLAHGSRNPAWAQPFERLAQRLRAARPGLAVRLAFFEHSPPSLEDALDELAAAGHRQVRIEVLVLSGGFHLDVDLPERVAQWRSRHADTAIAWGASLMDNERVQQALLDDITARLDRGEAAGAAGASPSA